jgi:hypothetical protein
MDLARPGRNAGVPMRRTIGRTEDRLVGGLDIGDHVWVSLHRPRARLTSGGSTWDLRPVRQPGGNPAHHSKLPTAEADVRRRLEWDLAQVVVALRGGREARAWELVREARALVARLPRRSSEEQRRKINAAMVVLRSSAWRAQAARKRHGTAE